MDEQPLSTGPTLNVLGRVFLSADDAASYAHERVGRRRDRGYFGYILQRSDQRFVITEPVEQQFRVNSHHQVIPDNHVLHSQFYSHPALSTLDASKVSQLHWSAADAATSLLMFSVEELRNILAGSLPAYLSGAEDSLIGFKPDSSRGESLRTQLGTTSAPGKLAQDLEAGTVKPEQLVLEAAAVGDLQIIISNGRWRPRGTVTGPVVAGPWERNLPEQAAFGAVYPSADEAALERYSRGTAQHDEDRTWFGFILKQQGKEEYVASELVPVSGTRDRLWKRNSLFGVAPRTLDYVYPETFQPHSYFYSRQQVKDAPGESILWLAKHFIVPLDLYIVIYDSKRRRVIETDTNASIPLYISTQDGALLKYVARGGTPLFDNDVPNMGVGEIGNNLNRGSLTSTGFVRLVANSGTLDVMRTSQSWDRKGVIDAGWIPNLNVERRTLSPVFHTADAAALHARSQLPQGKPSAFGGLILRRADGFFIATDPIIIAEENFDIRWVFSDEAVSAGLFPTQCTIVARYRSRIARALPVVMSTVDSELYLNMLSVDVISTTFSHSGQAYEEYLFAPDGSIIRYGVGIWQRLRAELEVAFSSSNDPIRQFDAARIKQQITLGMLAPTDWVKNLAKSGSLQVVSGSPLWGHARTVTEFVPFPADPGVSNPQDAVSEPVYSPVYVQEQDVARFVHDQADRHSSLSFGFILKNPRTGVIIATLPTTALNSKFAYKRVFPGDLPRYYFTSAIFLRAAQTQTGLTDEVDEHFFNPVAVSMARDVAYTSSEYRLIYFSCADGALLRLKLHTFDPSNTLDRLGQIQNKPNQFASPEQALRDLNEIRRGGASLTRYIRTMAVAGKLEVLVPSPYWSCPGEVSPDWIPYKPAISDAELWASNHVLPLGPIFQHPDDAAAYAQRRAAPIIKQAMCVSAILAKPILHMYVGVEPIADLEASNEPFLRIFRLASDASTNARNKVPAYPDGYRLIAGHELTRLEAHPTNANEVEFASTTSIYAYTHLLKSRGFDIDAFYYTTRQGALLKYRPTNSKGEVEFLLSSSGLASEKFVSELANIGMLAVLRPASDWNQSGRLGQNWKITRLQVPDVTDKPTRDEL